MAVGTAGQSSVRSEPNVVPMIDIMLVLLIIFMIVTPLIAAGFKATLPKGANLDADPEGENEVMLGIDADGNYFIDARPLAPGTLEDQLRARYESREKDKILYLKADNQLAYGKVQDAVETARKAGVRVIATVTERQGGLFAEASKADADRKKGK
jgi:biopolymer transport protein TolR